MPTVPLRPALFIWVRTRRGQRQEAVLNRPAKIFAEILPRFTSKPTVHKAHNCIFSDRDPLFYWLYARYKAGASTCLGFITPRSGVQVSPHYQLLLNSQSFTTAHLFHL